MSPLPRLLLPFTLPLRLLPTTFHSQALAAFLNQMMKESQQTGELDFLCGKRVMIEIEDLGVRYQLGSRNGRLYGDGIDAPPDAKIAGNLHDFLLLAARREDADTLFFQRRLKMSGDTELGLYLKNFLDAFEPPARWAPLTQTIDHLTNLWHPKQAQRE